MPVHMSLVYSVSRFYAYALLLTMHALLVGLYIVSLSNHTGGGVEIFCMLMHLFAATLIVTLAVFSWFNRKAEPSNTANLLFAGLVWFLTFLGAIVVTARAARQPGLVQDFSSFEQAYSTAVSVLTLSWLAMLLASMLAVLASVDKFPGATEITPFNASPARHRVVFHKNHKPLKIIEVVQGSDPSIWNREHGQYPQAPKAVHNRPTERYPMRQMNTTYSHWPDELV